MEFGGLFKTVLLYLSSFSSIFDNNEPGNFLACKIYRKNIRGANLTHSNLGSFQLTPLQLVQAIRKIVKMNFQSRQHLCHLTSIVPYHTHLISKAINCHMRKMQKFLLKQHSQIPFRFFTNYLIQQSKTCIGKDTIDHRKISKLKIIFRIQNFNKCFKSFCASDLNIFVKIKLMTSIQP